MYSCNYIQLTLIQPALSQNVKLTWWSFRIAYSGGLGENCGLYPRPQPKN